MLQGCRGPRGPQVRSFQTDVDVKLDENKSYVKVLCVFQGQPGVIGPEGERGMQGVMGQPGQKVIKSLSSPKTIFS